MENIYPVVGKICLRWSSSVSCLISHLNQSNPANLKSYHIVVRINEPVSVIVSQKNIKAIIIGKINR